MKGILEDEFKHEDEIVSRMAERKINFLSGMDVRKRVLTNLIVIACAAGITYGIGALVRLLFGV